MSEIKTGGPAFPFNAGEFGYEPSSGMMLRDWFAGQALSGISGEFIDKLRRRDYSHDEMQLAVKSFAKFAFVFADAMLAAREAQP